MKPSNAFISIIVPCRNEGKYIKNFLDSLTLQDYPKDQLEILIADGMSEDGTRDIIRLYKGKYPYIKLLDNPKKYTPSALNVAIKAAKGDIIIRLDSHAKYERDYISKCVKYLDQYQADNVGGTMKTVPSMPTLAARSIALCMGHGLGVGNSYFRKGSQKIREVDTVFGGCYRRELFKKIGLFDERLIRSQDLDFNLRLKKAGGKILLIPDIVSYYYPKSTFSSFLKHNFNDGQWTILPLKFTKTPFKLRHYVLFIFTSLLLLLGLLSFFSPVVWRLFLFTSASYLLAVLFSSVVISWKEKNMRLLVFLPVAFIIRHIGYGVGELVGFIRLFLK